MTAAILTKVLNFPYNVDRHYDFEDIYNVLKHKFLGITDPSDSDRLIPTHFRYPEESVIPDIEYPAIIIDHLFYTIDTTRLDNAMSRQEWLDLIEEKVLVEDAPLPIKINCQIAYYDIYRSPSARLSHFMFQMLNRCFALDVFGNKLTCLIEDAINLEMLTDATRRELHNIFPCTIFAQVYPSVITSLPIATQKIYRLTVI